MSIFPRRFWKRTGMAVFALLIGFDSVGAGETVGVPHRLDDVVITGTRTEKRLLDVPVRTEIVTREEIEKMHARDLKEALEEVPGLILRSSHGTEGQEVWMQGFDSNRVLVLVNGERLTASTGSTIDLTQIGAADIERIEIVKGATSVLYGSEAMGGVINVITKKPTKPFSFTLESDVGSYREKNLDSATLGDELDALHYMGDLRLKRQTWNLQVTGDVRQFDGFDLDKSDRRTDGDEGFRANLDGRIALTPKGGGELYFAPRFYREEKKRLFTTFTPGLGDILWQRREEADRWHLTLGGKVPFENGSRLTTTVVVERFDDVSMLDVVRSAQTDQTRTARFALGTGEVQWDLPVGASHIVTTGALFQKTTLAQSQVREGAAETIFVQEITPGASQENYSGYLQADLFLTKGLEMLPGVRYQHDSDFGSFIAPKINLLFKPAPSVSLRVGLGKGYRVPNLKERFFFFDHSALGYQVLGSPDLKPEGSDSYQLGIEWRRGETFHGDVNLFYNRIENLIATARNLPKSVATGLQIFDYQNVDRAETHGVEVATSYALSPHFGLKAGYTFLVAKDTQLDKTLTRRPRHQVKGGVDIRVPQWETALSLHATYQGKEFVDAENTQTSPSWTTLDVKMNHPLSKSVTLFVGVDNVLDTHREPGQFDDFRPNVPRFVYAGVRIER